jgi:hypothetical protein
LLITIRVVHRFFARYTEERDVYIFAKYATPSPNVVVDRQSAILVGFMANLLVSIAVVQVQPLCLRNSLLTAHLPRNLHFEHCNS